MARDIFLAGRTAAEQSPDSQDIEMDDSDANALAALGHEPIETNVRAVWRTAAVLAGVVLAIFVLTIGLMEWFAAGKGTTVENFASSNAPDPNRQLSLQQLRAQEKQMLNTWEWVDEASGTARIPVARAIEIISQTGLPAALQGTIAPDAAPTQPISPGNPPANAEDDEQ
jgi:hypothetical protein